jgi:ER-bound oxygenase mpaB/B'/Rubber oxygenase, catalytic domain
MTKTITNTYPTDAELDALRHVGDAPADAVLADVLVDAGAPDPAEGIRLLMRLLQQPIVPTTEPAVLRARMFFEGGAELPTWADQNTMRRARQFFNDHSVDIMSALFYGALPTCYASGDGAFVVRLSERLVTQTHRRTSETAQFLFDIFNTEGADAVMADALVPGSKGYRSTLGVRLMHASVRNFVARQPPEHDHVIESAIGLPINQEDLLGTMLAFSVVTLRALTAAGHDLEQADVDAYLHFWNVMGVLLGIRAEELPFAYPLTWNNAQRLTDRLNVRMVRPSLSGDQLMASLLEEMDQAARQFLGPIAGRLLVRAHPAMIRRMCSDEVCAALGIGNSRALRPLMALMAKVTSASDRARRSLGPQSGLPVGKDALAGLEAKRRWGPSALRTPLAAMARRGALATLYAYMNRDRGYGRPPFDFGTLPPLVEKR